MLTLAPGELDVDNRDYVELCTAVIDDRIETLEFAVWRCKLKLTTYSACQLLKDGFGVLPCTR